MGGRRGRGISLKAEKQFFDARPEYPGSGRLVGYYGAAAFPPHPRPV